MGTGDKGEVMVNDPKTVQGDEVTTTAIEPMLMKTMAIMKIFLFF